MYERCQVLMLKPVKIFTGYETSGFRDKSLNSCLSVRFGENVSGLRGYWLVVDHLKWSAKGAVMSSLMNFWIRWCFRGDEGKGKIWLEVTSKRTRSRTV
jgi:hypothetical protein